MANTISQLSLLISCQIVNQHLFTQSSSIDHFESTICDARHEYARTPVQLIHAARHNSIRNDQINREWFEWSFD